MNLTHASFFSGVGGLDLGLERAGWRTVSFSEIDPYASAVLAHRWPGVPKLGDIVDLAAEGGFVPEATLWTGGFPCQDLSVAGKRRGMGTHADRLDTRSGLAYAFLDLVERHRPPAILLENVPGLLSSHAGKDFGALLSRLGELGYGWAFRVLDAQHFGVPQRRRRVFICALRRGGHPDPDGAAAVLAVGTRCDRDHAAEREAWARTTGRAGGRPERVVGTVPAGLGHHGHAGTSSQAVASGHLVTQALTTRQERLNDPGDQEYVIVNRPAPDPRGDGAADGLARWLDDRAGVAATLNSGGNSGGFRTEPGEPAADHAAEYAADPLLPPGLDSHRYRCCGNGVVAPVAEWIGHRLAAWAQSLERVA